jgi:hypothetical protein
MNFQESGPDFSQAVFASPIWSPGSK